MLVDDPGSSQEELEAPRHLAAAGVVDAGSNTRLALGLGRNPIPYCYGILQDADYEVRMHTVAWRVCKRLGECMGHEI